MYRNFSTLGGLSQTQNAQDDRRVELFLYMKYFLKLFDQKQKEITCSLTRVETFNQIS